MFQNYFLNNWKKYFLFSLFFYSVTLSAQDKTFPREIDSLLKALKTTRIDSIRLKTLNELSWKEFRLEIPNDDVVLKYANEALALSKKLNNKYQEGLALYTMGYLLKRKNRLSEALKIFLTVLNLSEEINDKECAANQYYNIGDIYLLQGNLTKAIDHHLTAIQIWKETRNKQSMIRGYNGLAEVYLSSNFYDESIKYYQLALKTSGELNDNIQTAYEYQQLGIATSRKPDYPEARKYYLKAIEILEKSENYISGNNPAVCYIGMGWLNFMEAVYGKTLTPQQNYTEALEYFQKALKIGKVVRVRWFVEEPYIGIAETYKKLNNYEKALEYTVLRYNLKDSIFNNDAIEKFKRMKTQYEFEKTQIEEQARRQVFFARDNALKEKIRNEEKLKRELAEQKFQHEKILSEQKLNAEKNLAIEKAKQEKLNADKNLAIEKAKQEKLRSEKQQINNLLLIGLIFVILTSTFLLLYLRQRQLKKRALEKAEFVHKTAELELQSLRAQLNPHFMFNSLNAIQELILKEDNDNSHLYLSRFSDLLRMLLDNASLPFISIRKELVFLELYLSLENLRIPNLRYSFDVDPNINLDNIMIPNMMLQPYIENAIWHGLSYKKNDRNLKIRVHQDGACTTFEIEDNGIGRKKAAELKSLYRKGHKSKGMELLSKRFGLLSKEYGTTIRAEIFDLANDNDEATGTLVKLNIPFSLMEKEKLVVYDQNYNN